MMGGLATNGVSQNKNVAGTKRLARALLPRTHPVIGPLA
jgi:hypothetical protein